MFISKGASHIPAAGTCQLRRLVWSSWRCRGRVDSRCLCPSIRAVAADGAIGARDPNRHEVAQGVYRHGGRHPDDLRARDRIQTDVAYARDWNLLLIVTVRWRHGRNPGFAAAKEWRNDEHRVNKRRNEPLPEPQGAKDRGHCANGGLPLSRCPRRKRCTRRYRKLFQFLLQGGRKRSGGSTGGKRLPRLRPLDHLGVYAVHDGRAGAPPARPRAQCADLSSL